METPIKKDFIIFHSDMTIRIDNQITLHYLYQKTPYLNQCEKLPLNSIELKRHPLFYTPILLNLIKYFLLRPRLRVIFCHKSPSQFKSHF